MLLHIARESIHVGLRDGQTFEPSLQDYPENLLLACGNFVTLTCANNLRGCMGSLHTEKPLVQGVSINAFNAAFRDSRFAALSHFELGDIEVELSLLTPPTRLKVNSESEAIERLSPGKDGLIFEVGDYRATFLPTVWRQIPEPARFVQQIKLRAGLPEDFWSRHVKLSRYRALSFSEEELLGQA